MAHSSNLRYMCGKVAGGIRQFFRLILDVLLEIVTGIGRWFIRCGRFLKSDHCYVYLGTDVLFFVTLFLYNRAILGGQSAQQTYSIFKNLPAVLPTLLIGVGGIWFLFTLAAFAAKLKTGKAYSNHSFFKSAGVIRASRYVSYLVGAIFALFLLENVVLSVYSTLVYSLALDKNPQNFFESMIYMANAGSQLLARGLSITIRLALGGTFFGFILAVLLVFLRIQEPDKRDNDFIKFLKIIGNSFSKTYITVIRGTPMMVQVLIIYYSGFKVVRGMGYNITQVNAIWSFFNAGLITISLNTTAYLAEVLRGAIEALDKGQDEAARSLGLTRWQAMMKVIFPQAVKNSVPAIGNEFIINIKDSSVLQIIGVVDLMYATSTIAGIYAKQLEIYCVTALIYLCLTYFLSKLLNLVSRKMDMPTSRGIPSSN